MKKFILILLIVNCSLLIVKAQPSFTYQRLYSGPEDCCDVGHGICKCTNNSQFVLAQSGVYMYLFRINSLGDTLWTKSLYLYYAGAITSISGGCAIICGNANSANTTTCLIKIDSASNITLQRNYNFVIAAQEIINQVNGSFVVCGPTTPNDSRAIKLDSSGNLIWNTNFPSSHILELNRIKMAFGGGYIAAGNDYRDYPDTSRAIVYRLDEGGNILWQKNYRINGYPTDATAMEVLNNSYIITGKTIDPASGFRDRIYILKIDTAGNQLYERNFTDNASFCETSTDIKILSPNRYVYSTFREENCGGMHEARILISDSTGNILISRTFTTIFRIGLSRILPLLNNDIIFTGFLDSKENHGTYLIRTDSNLYTPPLEVHLISNNVPRKFILYQNYPNPFNPSTKIRFVVPLNKGGYRGLFVKLTIYDIMGKEVETIVNKILAPGEYDADWDGKNYSSGVYFYKIESGSFVDTKKLVLIK